MTKKTAEILSEIVDLLEPVSSEERRRIFQAAMALLGEAPASVNALQRSAAPAISNNGGDLRSFMAESKPKGAVAEIPALLFWAKQNEGKTTANEKDVIELYRRAGLRPPKDVLQSFRDLCSKKYMRLQTVEGERGHVQLARAGEDFVLHDLISKAT